MCVFVQLAMVTVLLHTEDSQHLIFKKLFSLMGLWSIWADVLQAATAGAALLHVSPILLLGPVGRPRHVFLIAKAEVQEGKWKHPRLLKSQA